MSHSGYERQQELAKHGDAVKTANHGTAVVINYTLSIQ